MSSKIAVAGAGAAGLMAALELSSAGHDVTVFEGRSRVGGRIHTVRFADGRFANAGAEWVNSSDTLTLELASRYGLDMIERFGFEALVADGRPVLDVESYPGIDEAFEAVASRITIVAEPWNDPVARELDRISVAEWAYGTGAAPEVLERFFRDCEGEFMAPVVNLSMAAAAISSLLTNNDRAFRFRRGTAALPEAMASDLGASTIRLDEIVERVTNGDDGVSVGTSKGDYAFDALILALPLPTLARVKVEPDLEVPWIGQGRGGKLMVPYENGPRGPVVHSSPGTGQKFTYVNASHQPGDGVILTAYSDQVLDATEVTDSFSRWFPDLVRSQEEPIAAWWSLDPLSGTTYSAPQPGYLGALRRLRQPTSRVFLAGEHTEILFGYVESALVSGRRIAGDVDSVLSGRQLDGRLWT